MVPNDQTEHVDLGKQNGGSMRVGSSSRRRGDLDAKARPQSRDYLTSPAKRPIHVCAPQELGGAHSSFTFELHLE